MLKISGFLSGALEAVEGEAQNLVRIGVADVAKVFDLARTGVAGAKIPDALKSDFTATLNDAETTVAGLTGIAGTELGTIVAEGVDGVTNLFSWLTQRVAGAKAAADYSPAEKAAVQQGATALISQLQTLATQAQVGITAAIPTDPAANTTPLQKAA